MSRKNIAIRKIKTYARDLLRSLPGMIWRVSKFFYKPGKNKRNSQSPKPPFLIIATNGIGDTINLLPAIKMIRQAYPQARIDCVVQPLTLELLKCVDSVDKTFALYKGPFRLSIKKAFFNMVQIVKLRREKYKTIICFASNFYTAWRSFLIGADRRYGYSRKEKIGFLSIDDFGFLYTDDYKDLKFSDNRMQEHIDFIQAAGIPVSLEQVKPLLVVDAKQKEQVKRFFDSKNADQKSIIIHPFCSQGTRVWPMEKYIELINELLATGLFHIILCGGKNERDYLYEIKKGCKGEIEIVSDLGLNYFIALVSCVDLLVGNDSSSIHIAAAVSTRAIGIFGPTDPLKALPLKANIVAVKEKHDCSPCYAKGSYEKCYLGHHSCLESLEVKKVLSAITKALKEK